MELEGRVALVTGGGSGIGSAVVQALSDAGAAVCVNWFQDWGETAREHAARLPRAFAFEADVGDPQRVQEMVAATLERFGRLDVLVNNAAIVRPAPLLDVRLADWDAVLDVNLRGAFCCLQAAARAMRDGGRGGAIVNISSIHEDAPFPGFTAYVVAKGGLRMLMRNAALELAPAGIRVNNVAPGAIATPVNAATLADPETMATLERVVPQGRMGTPEEVAEVVLFLASDRAAYVTGSTYEVDGGLSRHAEPV